ncbi:hypothetical protein AAFF_G00024250 [Aldrovandia affinis]|uniref:Uncharacterized protein n=1 Tax=Aldrovandia affinis TaxID=143900 RepID=A0AAD7T5S0_9TELE|nr:hypothetical protein AAFF_G00024250 [Aldrovandia affinis]
MSGDRALRPRLLSLSQKQCYVHCHCRCHSQRRKGLTQRDTLRRPEPAVGTRISVIILITLPVVSERVLTHAQA